MATPPIQEPPEIPPPTPGQPTEPPPELPPASPRPEAPPPIDDPAQPPQPPQELPGPTPDEMPLRSVSEDQTSCPVNDPGIVELPDFETDVFSGVPIQPGTL